MNLRLATLAGFGREVALPASVLVWMVGSGFAGADRSAAAPIIDRLAQSLTADASFADKIQPITPRTIDIAAADKPAMKAAVADVPPAAPQVEPVATAAPTASAEMLPPDDPPRPESRTILASLEPADAIQDDAAGQAGGSAEAKDECLVAGSCVDHYLWTLYQRTPKEDSVKISEQRKVTVRKKHRMVTVTRTFTKLVDEDFSWKDPKAAEHFGKPLDDYVIGGMDRDFKVKLVQMLRAADAAGLSPGITSAFRDDYRQSIASGLKAADNRSYHGGSLRGGYGHGLAADIVSINGATRGERLNASETLWKWVDAHGKEFGIGRPYLDRDPPHVGPIDGKEYADHHPGTKAREARAAARHSHGHGLASREGHGASRHARTAASSKVRTG
jgi:LAS superfamily LD-carboxypeptidase LdcB